MNATDYPWALRAERFSNETWGPPSRADWGAGPWQDEPDLVEWRVNELPGYALLILRGGMGALCGYVGVPESHPLHGKRRVLGCTWAGPCDERRVPSGEPPTCWWLGFDCAHGSEYAPLMHAHSSWLSDLTQLPPLHPVNEPSEYVTLEVCRERVEALAIIFATAAQTPTVLDVLIAAG